MAENEKKEKGKELETIYAIKESLSEKYFNNPDLLFQDLAEIRKKYNIKTISSPFPLSL